MREQRDLLEAASNPLLDGGREALDSDGGASLTQTVEDELMSPDDSGVASGLKGCPKARFRCAKPVPIL